MARKLNMIFHGVRGSRPVHHPDFLQMGGNTTCVEFDSGEDFVILLDAGSGLANMGYKLESPLRRKRFHVLMTHTHWDHVLSIPWFLPLFDPTAHVTFYAADGSNGIFKDLFQRMFSYGHLSQPANLLRAKIDFVNVVPRVPFVIEGHVRVEGVQLNHQAVTLGYKVASGNSSSVVITDTAPLMHGNYLGDGMPEAIKAEGEEAFQKRFEKELVSFVSGVSVLVFDTHFNDQNFKPDWGHSTPGLALDLCRKAGVPKLIMFHHAPEDNDRQVIDKMQQIHADALAAGIEVVNAREGDEWNLKSA